MDKEGQIDLREYLRIVMKRRWTVVTVFAIIVISVTIHSLTATPIYEATVRLEIEKENQNYLSIDEVMAVDASGTDYYQTQYRIIESRSVAREAIRRLNLEKSREFFPKSKVGFLSNLRRSIGDSITFWKKSTATLFKGEKGAKTAGIFEEYAPDSSLVTAFINRIKVVPIRNSRLVDVKFQAKDPAIAAKIANTLAYAYIDQNLEIKVKAVQNAMKWLHGRIEEERKKVEKAERTLLEYKERYEIVTDFSTDAETITAQKLAQLNAQVVEAESKRVEAETRYKQALALMDSPDMLDSIPEVIHNELIGEIKRMEVDLYKQMSELSKKYGKKHPRMVAIQSELNALHKRKSQEIDRIINSLSNEYNVAKAREDSLKAALSRQKGESLDLNQKAIQYGMIQREAESARSIYELLFKRFKETALTENMNTGNIRVVDRAEVPKSPVKPRRKLNFFLAVIVGLITGVGLAFFFEYLDNTIKLPEDVTQHLKIPYLGPVPLFEPEAEGTSEDDRTPELMTLHSPKSTASEAFRGIRTSILFSSAESIPQIILISSSGPREGKTIAAANLAVTMAQAGSKVIILDCDMRRPMLHKLFGLEKNQGVSNLLVEGNDIEGTISHTQVPNLDLIPSGPIPPNPSELLGSTRMTGLLNALRKKYTRVIIDTPPCTAVTDAVVLSKVTDGVVIVIRAGRTPREIAMNGVVQFKSVGSHIIGAILNGVDMGRDSYYYQYYYYYYGEDGLERKKSRRKRKLADLYVRKKD